MLRTLTCLSLLFAAGCASVPFVCTPSSCVSVATQDLPSEIRGEWVTDDGATLEVIDYHLDTVDGAVVPKAASILVRAENAPMIQAHITSFDQRIVVGEQYMGNPLQRSETNTSRFYRLQVNDGQLRMSRLKLEALTDALDGPDVRIVPQEGLDAVQYDDILGMAATMVQLLGRDEAWEDEQVFTRG